MSETELTTGENAPMRKNERSRYVFISFASWLAVWAVVLTLLFAGAPTNDLHFMYLLALVPLSVMALIFLIKPNPDYFAFGLFAIKFVVVAALFIWQSKKFTEQDVGAAGYLVMLELFVIFVISSIFGIVSLYSGKPGFPYSNPKMNQHQK